MRENQRSPSFDPLSLPPELGSLTGRIQSSEPMKADGPCLVLLLEAEHGTFVLKIARGGYRSQELRAEHTALQLLHDSPVPIPESVAYVESDDLSYHLRAYAPGEPLSILMESNERIRMDAVDQMGRLLASIHSTSIADNWTWDEWIKASLDIAARNMAANVFDPDEFTPEEPPSVAMDWLLADRPARGGTTCLLHGDYRPKNMLWENGRIAGVIDWQFVDIGDPYYDLSVIHWYMRDEAEWQRFLDGYGLVGFDQERFNYCLVLQKFLNV